MIGATPNWFDPAHVEQVVLERFIFHARQTVFLESIAPMMVRDGQVQAMRYMDECARAMALTLYTNVAKGETTHESKRVEHEYEFNVFASWQDHLKYQIKQKRLLPWLPERLRKRIKVRYQRIVKKRSDEIPVTVIRVCPHATFKWEGSHQRVHLQFLFPSRRGFDSL